MKGEQIRQALASIEGVEWLEEGVAGRIEIPASTTRNWIVWHDGAKDSKVEIYLERGAHLQLTEIITSDTHRTLSIHQAEGSLTEITLLLLGPAKSTCEISLEEPHAESRLNGLFLAASHERCAVNLRTNHQASDGHSVSLIKGVAGGEQAEGEFRGLVYVAPDAQRTDARQNSRNIELTSGARIQTLPQLEIYADDVKCSHGATVGQLDSEAILYMRQRGLSEREARRLQIEGFAEDVVCHLTNESLSTLLCEVISEKLQTM